MRKCKVDECERESMSKLNYCLAHYKQIKRNGTITKNTKPLPICNVIDCKRMSYIKGYCSKHYAQLNKNGKISERTRFDPNRIIIERDYAKIELYNKEMLPCAYARIDIKNIEKVSKLKWYLNAKGYVSTNKRPLLLSRFIMGVDTWKVGENEVDHISRDKLDNRKINLRFVDRTKNALNMGMLKNNTSGIKGVYRSGDKWLARITIDKHIFPLGFYTDKEDAINIRRLYENKRLKEVGLI